MPGPRTASYLVAMVRDHIQQLGFQFTYRDGFPADATDPITGAAATATPILRYINKAFNELLPTGFCKCIYTFFTVAGQAEYSLDPGIHEIYHVTIGGQPLTAVTMLELDQTGPGWQNYAGNNNRGRPTMHYNYSDVMGLNPAPDQNYTVSILCDSYPPDLVAPTDTPTRLEARFHEALADRAAWWICNMDQENPVAKARMPAFESVWKATLVDLERLAQSRELDRNDQINVMEYRRYTSRGGST